jgi:S-(hydroxymethyl)glutathione dehydrogenase/alcohol dehydrogenase
MKKTTDGLGADVCIDAVGAEATGSMLQTIFGKRLKLEAGSAIALHWAINSVKKGGIVSVVGVYGPTGNIVPMGNIVNKGLTLRGNQAAVKRHVPKLIEHIRAGHIDPKKIITHRVPLDDIGDAYHMFSDKLDNMIKPVLLPNGA